MENISVLVVFIFSLFFIFYFLFYYLQGDGAVSFSSFEVITINHTTILLYRVTLHFSIVMLFHSEPDIQARRSYDFLLKLIVLVARDVTLVLVLQRQTGSTWKNTRRSLRISSSNNFSKHTRKQRAVAIVFSIQIAAGCPSIRIYRLLISRD